MKFNDILDLILQILFVIVSVGIVSKFIFFHILWLSTFLLSLVLLFSREIFKGLKNFVKWFKNIVKK